MWDLGGKKGQAYELNGHHSKVLRLQYAEEKERPLSVGAAGTFAGTKKITPRRRNARFPHMLVSPSLARKNALLGTCDRCDSPFFRNFQDLSDHCERLMAYKNEVNELLLWAQEFETVRDKNIIPDYIKNYVPEEPENSVDVFASPKEKLVSSEA
ncbi:hypothetical protein QR680_000559 [Steinernema hermaphroditum]|uniref:Uncharacterized protein n=1 Tax=Steinernema hermaphroditum TaxID=289476 RepID=A0AA39LEH8_9BILA|nr:hypothetical protein QR680_000559 [Steinernema hermaphroditum]